MHIPTYSYTIRSLQGDKDSGGVIAGCPTGLRIGFLPAVGMTRQEGNGWQGGCILKAGKEDHCRKRPHSPLTIPHAPFFLYLIRICPL